MKLVVKGRYIGTGWYLKEVIVKVDASKQGLGNVQEENPMVYPSLSLITTEINHARFVKDICTHLIVSTSTHMSVRHLCPLWHAIFPQWIIKTTWLSPVIVIFLSWKKWEAQRVRLSDGVNWSNFTEVKGADLHKLRICSQSCQGLPTG